MAEKRFPEGFLWGAATASYQVEGGIENNDWSQAAREGKVPVAGRACDHYNRYEEDFNIAKSLGHTTHRFSIEWSRIEPEEGQFDEKEIAHYRSVLDALRARGLHPMVTLWHFTLPLWLAEKGGAESKEFPRYFARYCEYVTRELGADDILFVTINEPFVFAALGWIRGEWAPFERKRYLRFYRVARNLVRAHNKAARAIKKTNPSFIVGIVKNNKHVRAGWNPAAKLAAVGIRWFWNRWLLNRVRGHIDFIGLNYYFHQSLDVPDDFPRSDMGWPIYAKGLYFALLELRRYKLPIYITENGIADADDDQRADFIREHLAAIHAAIQEGADVRGYYYWSLLDNYEWAHGFEKRFGLVEIDYETLERAVRPSAQLYKRICETNALEY